MNLPPLVVGGEEETWHKSDHSRNSDMPGMRILKVRSATVAQHIVNTRGHRDGPGRLPVSSQCFSSLQLLPQGEAT